MIVEAQHLNVKTNKLTGQINICDNVITGGKLVSGKKLKNKLSSGEFKTIQNEGESTVWRYFCLVVKALNIPYLNILISSQVNVFASHASPLYKSVVSMTTCKWIRRRLLDYVDRFITNFVHLKFKKKRNCHLESLKRHSRGNLLLAYGDISVGWHHILCGF